MVKKRNWKRIDVSAVHESLVESNIARNLARKGIANDIVIDVSGHTPSKRLAKKIKAQQKAGGLAQRGRVERARLQKLVKRLKNESDLIDIDRVDEPSSEKVKGEITGISASLQGDNKDIWADDGEKPAKRRPKMSNIYKIIPAVTAPHAGQSYNPEPEAYNELIDEVVEAIPKTELQSSEPLTDLIQRALPSLEADSLSFKKKQKLANLIAQEKIDADSVMAVLNEMTDDEDDSDFEGDDDAGLDGDEEARRTRKLRRKTRTQRNRQKLHRESVKQSLIRKRVKKLIHDIQHLKENTKDGEEKSNRGTKETKKERLRSYLERLIQGKAATRFGNKVYKAEPEQVALPDEMTSCIRQLQTPVKSPVDNVIRSIYSRGLVPPPAVLNRNYRDYISKKVIKRSMKYKSRLLEGTT